MQKKTIFIVFQIIVSFVVCHQALGQQPLNEWRYRFPLDIKPKVSGSFGEIRSNHFHSGLDLATNGKNGWPVFAADSGYVSRISVSPYGFGKALYIDHPAGITTVYAHLEKFSENIDSLVTARQYDNESFTLSATFEKREYPIKRGEIIGYSGNSGSSAGPHLHFEVRETRGQRPVDPLAFPNPVKDDVRPHIAGIKIYPLSEDAVINGKHEEQYFPAVFYNGAFHLKNNPHIKAGGTIGVGIEVLDYYTGSWRKCGVHSIDLQVNGKRHYNYTMNGFYFHETRYLNSHIDYSEKKKNHRTIQKSFVDPYNRIDLYKVDDKRGEIDLSAGTGYRLSYTVKDISGNTSELKFNVSGGDSRSIPAESKDFPDSRDHIDASRSYYYEEDKHSVSFPEESFYRDTPASFRVEDSDESLSGTVFSVLDETIPVHKWFDIKIPLPEETDEEGLCGAKRSGNGESEYIGGELEGTYFVIKARSGGDYFLTRDTIPPEIRIKNKPVRMDYSQKKTLVAEVKDDFSGIEEYEATINGKWALFEYDAKNDRIICFLDKVPFLKRGEEHTLLIEATDKAGQNSRLETNFRY
ncbi:MAG: M23 family metallopeptidase [Marinilabilia sp.]